MFFLSLNIYFLAVSRTYIRQESGKGIQKYLLLRNDFFTVAVAPHPSSLKEAQHPTLVILSMEESDVPPGDVKKDGRR